MYLAKNRYQYRALVNTVMNFRFPYNAGNLLTSKVTTQEGLCSIELIAIATMTTLQCPLVLLVNVFWRQSAF